jgi:hypothetical protein
MKCKNTAHDDKPIRGSTRVRCAKCGDEFPCARSCEHLDCMQRRGEPPPEWADYEQASANATETLADRQLQKVLRFGARTGTGPQRLLADLPDREEPDAKCLTDSDAFSIGKICAAEASIAKLEEDHPQVKRYREWLDTETHKIQPGIMHPHMHAISVDFGCADETGRVACSHVVIDGEHTLHMIPPGEHEAKLVSIDVVDGKLVQTIRLVEPDVTK